MFFFFFLLNNTLSFFPFTLPFSNKKANKCFINRKQQQQKQTKTKKTVLHQGREAI